MKQGSFEIVSNRNIARSTFEMKLCGDASELKRAGQFVEISLNGFFLRRPFSVSRFDRNGFDIVYKTVGEGTRYMSSLKAGDNLDVLTGLGNGFDVERAIMQKAVLVCGGAGVPPVYCLAKAMVGSGFKPTVVMGFNSADETFFVSDFREIGIEPIIATADGSEGIKGFATDAALTATGGALGYVCACGPEPMLKALYSLCAGGQLSLEARMGCGFGACMGCSVKTNAGYKQVCKDGPVFCTEELLWQI